MKTRYKKIIVIGNGSLLTNCLKHIRQYSGNNLTCIEYHKKNFSNLKAICNSEEIEYISAEDKETLFEIFAAINVDTLILSIHNSYLFPKKVLSNKNLKIINFHNSLLPNHPGRNAPTWAIYDMDAESGITWHEVIREIDKGGIVTQKSITIDSKMTGIDLTKECVRLGFESFKEIFPSILSQAYTLIKQNSSDLIKMHYSYETPNNGILNAGWDVQQMSAFLRSIDYGVYPIFEKPKILLNGEWFKILKYKLLSNSINEVGENNREELYFSNKELVIKLNIKPL